MISAERRDVAERAIQVHLLHDATRIEQLRNSLDLETLSDDTWELAGIIVEFPALCRNVGVFSVAVYIRASDDLVRHLDELISLPAWVLQILPGFSQAIRELSDAGHGRAVDTSRNLKTDCSSTVRLGSPVPSGR